MKITPPSEWYLKGQTRLHGMFTVALIVAACSISIDPERDISVGGFGYRRTTCTAGNSCTCDLDSGNCYFECPGGNCVFECPATFTGNCILSCEGGGCTANCSNIGNCSMDCSGNNCSATCSGVNNCNVSDCRSGCRKTCNNTGTCVCLAGCS